MSRKHTRRRHYALVNPIAMAILGSRPADASVLDEVRIRNLSAIEAFATGKATVHDWRTVADMHNVAETMAKGGVGPEVLEACAAVDAALTDCYLRHERTGRLGMTGPQLVALRELHEYHDLQIQSITRGEFERWIKLTADRIRSAHPDVKVFI
jgi:hypothetical protein